MGEGVVREEAGKVGRGGYIAPTLGTMEQVLYFTTAPSVTEKAKQVLDQERLRVPGAVVVWDETIGRRKGSKAIPKGWWAGHGSLTVTFALPRCEDLEPQERLNRAAAAVIRVASSFSPRVPITFRPPNDLLIDALKLGALTFEPHHTSNANIGLLTVRLNCTLDLGKAPPHIASGAARLIDFIDPLQLPLKKAGTLPNTFLTRLMIAIPKRFASADER